MATKLKNLKIKKVAFVDEGANPDAHIGMIKRKDGKELAAGGGKGKSTGFWKHLLGFIGNAAGMDQEEINSAVEQIEKDGSESFGTKMAQRKNQKIADEIWDVCFALQASLCSILWDEDLDSAAASASMMGSIDEFCAVVKDSVSQWSGGKAAGISKSSKGITAGELEVMEGIHKRVSEAIEKAQAGPEGKGAGSKEDPEGEKKGETDMGKIDKSKLTDAERAFLEDIEKRCPAEEPAAGNGAENINKGSSGKDGAGGDGIGPGGKTGTEDRDAVAKALKALGLGADGQPAEEPEDIYKGLHPAVKAELESLRKFREASEEKELREVAKRYAVIGKKEEELLPVLKNLKAAGGTAYDDMVAILDQAVGTVEKSGVFGEIGKSGGHYAAAPLAGSPAAKSDPETKIEGIAKGYMEKDPEMGFTQAVAKAWEDNPELMAAYDEEAGF